jgi:hypothetical protein
MANNQKKFSNYKKSILEKTETLLDDFVQYKNFTELYSQKKSTDTRIYKLIFSKYSFIQHNITKKIFEFLVQEEIKDFILWESKDKTNFINIFLSTNNINFLIENIKNIKCTKQNFKKISTIIDILIIDKAIDNINYYLSKNNILNYTLCNFINHFDTYKEYCSNQDIEYYTNKFNKISKTQNKKEPIVENYIPLIKQYYFCKENYNYYPAELIKYLTFDNNLNMFDTTSYDESIKNEFKNRKYYEFTMKDYNKTNIIKTFDEYIDSDYDSDNNTKKIKSKKIKPVRKDRKSKTTVTKDTKPKSKTTITKDTKPKSKTTVTKDTKPKSKTTVTKDTKPTVKKTVKKDTKPIVTKASKSKSKKPTTDKDTKPKAKKAVTNSTTIKPKLKSPVIPKNNNILYNSDNNNNYDSDCDNLSDNGSYFSPDV